MVKSYTTGSPSQTRKFGEKLTKEILKQKTKKAVVIGLTGELGSGKTTFLQGFAKGLYVKERILSPTFVIMRKFKINHLAAKPFGYFYHIDCYRIQKPKEILGFGFKKIVDNPQNIVAIEWADRIRKLLPKRVLFLEFSFVDESKRKIVLKFKR